MSVADIGLVEFVDCALVQILRSRPNVGIQQRLFILAEAVVTPALKIKLYFFKTQVLLNGDGTLCRIYLYSIGVGATNVRS